MSKFEFVSIRTIREEYQTRIESEVRRDMRATRSGDVERFGLGYWARTVAEEHVEEVAAERAERRRKWRRHEEELYRGINAAHGDSLAISRREMRAAITESLGSQWDAYAEEAAKLAEEVGEFGEWY